MNGPSNPRLRALGWLLLAAGACRSSPTTDAANGLASASAPTPETLAPAAVAPAPPKGMVWIAPGVLLAGTPPGKLPRIADQEMPGEQVVLQGFFMDEYPYPNEPGAIPKTNVTHAQADAICAEQNKRLCTELEWERACKGPSNQTYPYGETYRSSDCGTGTPSAAVPPTGLLPLCRSGFGVRDLHGNVWQWTASPWGRGTSGRLFTQRGGNGPVGDVFGRCANAMGRRPDEHRPDVGLRCCQGERNAAEVTLTPVHGDGVHPISNDPALIAGLAQSPPPALAPFLSEAPGSGETSDRTFRVQSTWQWHPIHDEELVLQSGCAHPAGKRAFCGVAFGRLRGAKVLEPVGFVPSGWWLPEVHGSDDPRQLTVVGGDEQGSFWREVAYAFGRLEPGEAARKNKKKKHERAKRER